MSLHTNRMVFIKIIPRPTKTAPERGNARIRLLEAARDIIHQKGFAATTVDDLCQSADVTKGAFFHHFKTKDALGVAAADYWPRRPAHFLPEHRITRPTTRWTAFWPIWSSANPSLEARLLNTPASLAP